ncbi:MAG: hypothetical protein HOV81_28260 [Kofleriaceae bacterium]|nr:hypothetical protein [Kofleriaceae bacterium]
MRIPTSVFVMSVLTAVPFGLGIKDTLTHKQPTFDDDAFDFTADSARDRARERRYAEYERQAEQEKLERTKRRDERTAKLDTLYGKQPASLGSLFDGIQLGADAGSFQPEIARERIYDATRDGFLNVVFDVDSTQLRGLTVELSTVDYTETIEETCEKLRDKLTTAWGRIAGSTWLDPSTHQRASIDSSYCALRFDRYLDTTDWLAGIHMEAIGMKADKLAALVGPTAIVDSDMVSWHLPGVGFGTKSTTVEAYLENGKVVTIAATTDADFDTIAAIRDAISAKRKDEPTTDAQTGAWSWKGKVPVTLDNTRVSRFDLVVGKGSW